MTYSGCKFLHQNVKLLAELRSNTDEDEFAGRLGGGGLLAREEPLQQRVLAVLDQELQRGVQRVVVLLQELDLIGAEEFLMYIELALRTQFLICVRFFVSVFCSFRTVKCLHIKKDLLLINIFIIIVIIIVQEQLHYLWLWK